MRTRLRHAAGASRRWCRTAYGAVALPEPLVRRWNSPYLYRNDWETMAAFSERVCDDIRIMCALLGPRGAHGPAVASPDASRTAQVAQIGTEVLELRVQKRRRPTDAQATCPSSGQRQTTSKSVIAEGLVTHPDEAGSRQLAAVDVMPRPLCATSRGAIEWGCDCSLNPGHRTRYLLIRFPPLFEGSGDGGPPRFTAVRRVKGQYPARSSGS